MKEDKRTEPCSTCRLIPNESTKFAPQRMETSLWGARHSGAPSRPRWVDAPNLGNPAGHRGARQKRVTKRSCQESRRKPWSVPDFGLDPVARFQEIRIQLLLRRAGLGLPVVAPGNARRQRHQDRLGAPARLQAEQRAAVVHQVELDVAPAPVGLEIPFALAERMVLPALEDRQVRFQQMIAHRFRQVEGGLFREVIEEDAADPPRLAAMAQLEVFVAPLLEARVVACAEWRQSLSTNAMEMARIVLEAVVGREVHAAAEPPGVAGGKEAHVHVHGRTKRI